MLMSNNNDWERSSAEFLNLLRCPDCSSKLEKNDNALRCTKCGHSYPIADGIIHFVPSEDYVGNFGFEWTKYNKTQLDQHGSNISGDAFEKRTGFTPELLRGKWVLDAGCGMGRFAEVASRCGANVVAVDLSRAAEAAAKNLAERPNVWVCRADLRKLPFAPESFDYIYSIGVLHHTPDCEQSFKGLVPFVKPGGNIAIWLYSAYNKYYRMSDIYRKFTTRMSPRSLHRVCVLIDVFYNVQKGLRRIPLVGRYLGGIIVYMVPMSTLPQREWRLLDNFDWYSPKYQTKHTYEEVFRWFEACGLGELRVILEPIAVQGRKRA